MIGNFHERPVRRPLEDETEGLLRGEEDIVENVVLEGGGGEEGIGLTKLVRRPGETWR